MLLFFFSHFFSFRVGVNRKHLDVTIFSFFFLYIFFLKNTAQQVCRLKTGLLKLIPESFYGNLIRRLCCYVCDIHFFRLGF